jgi:hypothetical protein
MAITYSISDLAKEFDLTTPAPILWFMETATRHQRPGEHSRINRT